MDTWTSIDDDTHACIFILFVAAAKAQLDYELSTQMLHSYMVSRFFVFAFPLSVVFARFLLFAIAHGPPK